MTAPFRTIPHLSPIDAPVRELGLLATILLTIDRPWTADEIAMVEAADHDAGDDPLAGMTEIFS
jgi:hypothetical protein